MKTIYVFDVDDTLIATTACIRAIDKNGNVAFRAGTKIFNAPDSTERLLRPGLSWDFSEFESLDQLKSEPKKISFDVLKELSTDPQKVPTIHIVTARQRQDIIYEWLKSEGVTILFKNIHCLDRNYQGSVAQWKADVVNELISIDPTTVHLFEDDINNQKAISALSEIDDNVRVQVHDIISGL